MPFYNSDSGSLSAYYQGFGIISLVLSFGVLSTIAIFQKHMLVQSRPFTHAIFMISLCDFADAIGFIFGFRSNGTFLCSAQGFLVLFSYSGSWAWTCMLIYQIRCAVSFRTPYFSILGMHIVSWIMPLIITLLPLTTNTYGQDDELNGIAPCVIGGKNTHMKDSWFFLFSAFQWVCILFLFICIGDIYRRKRISGLSSKESRVISNTILYPIGMIVTVCPIFMTFSILASGVPVDMYAYQVIEILATQYGTVVGLIFFVYCAEARLRWWRLFRSLWIVAPVINDLNKDSSRTISAGSDIWAGVRLVSVDDDINSRLASFEGEEEFFVSAKGSSPNLDISTFPPSQTRFVNRDINLTRTGEWGVSSVDF